MVTSEDIGESLYNRLMKIEKEALLSLMLDALTDMQSYNGRTLSWCILNNIGTEMDNGKWRVLKPEAINEKYGVKA